jgi:hypothetical protein
MRTLNLLCATCSLGALLLFPQYSDASAESQSAPPPQPRSLSFRAQGDASNLDDAQAIPPSYPPPTGFMGADWGSTPHELAQLAVPLQFNMISATSDAKVPELFEARCPEMEHFNVYSCLESNTLRQDNRDPRLVHTLAIVEYQVSETEIVLPDTGGRFSKGWADFCAMYTGIDKLERLDYHLSRLKERAQLCGVKLFFTASDTPAGFENSERVLRALKRAFGNTISGSPLPTTAIARLERYFWCAGLHVPPGTHATPCPADVMYAFDRNAHAGVVLIVTPLVYSYIECQFESGVKLGNPLFPTDWYLLLLLDSPPMDFASVSPIICTDCEVHRGRKRLPSRAPSFSGDIEAPPGITHDRYDSIWDLPVWARHP